MDSKLPIPCRYLITTGSFYDFCKRLSCYGITHELLPLGLFCDECKRKRGDAESLETEWRSRLWAELNRRDIKKLLSVAGVPPLYQDCSLENFQPNPPLFRPAFLTGPAGTGKTHLAVGFLRKEILDKGRGSGRFLRAVDLFRDIRNSFREGSDKSEEGILELYSRGTSFLVLDDLGAEKVTDFGGQTLYDLIDYRYTHRLATLITSNLSLDQLARHYCSHGDRLASRIAGMGGTLALMGKDRRWEV